MFVAITVAVGIGALNTGNNLLFLCLGLLLSIITVSGILSEMNVVRLHIELKPETLFVAGVPQYFEFEVTNQHKRRASYAVTVRVKWLRQVEGETKETDSVEANSSIIVLGPTQSQFVRGEMRFAERGEYKLREVLFQTEYPFGLFQKTRVVHLPGRVLVAPQPDVTASLPTQAIVASGSVQHNKVGHSVEPFDLREAQPDEDTRNIHWAKSAARGQLVAVRRASEMSDAVVLAIGQGKAGDPVFEGTLRRATQLVRTRMASGAKTALLTAEGASVLGAGALHERALLTMLALARGGAQADKIPRALLRAPVVWL